MENDSNVALIVGASGMVGLSLAEALTNKSSVLGSPWKVYGASRRPPPTYFPSSLVHQYITFDASNLDHTTKALSPISSEITHIFWVAFQLRDSEQVNIALNSAMLTNVLTALNVSSPSSRLRHVTLQTGTKHYMGPVFDPDLMGALVPHEPPFREEYPRLPFPNFYYALEDLVASFATNFSYSVHRSSIIMGASSRSFHNSLLTLSVYATICKHQGLPFRYPGTKYTWEHFCDMSDARVLAQQHIWAAMTDKAKNEAFNCTNGDVFTWKSFWRTLCNIFDLEFLLYCEGDQFDLEEIMKDKGKIWDNVVEKYGLNKTKMEEITCFSALQTVMKLDFQLVSSMNKSREFGFFEHVDTLKSVEMWVMKLRQMKIIP